ncbi:hypothetical protein QBC37DRAFT_460910 [Rhypophila decipiens]|uniref:Endothelin-converting enzyme 1 n=1 Tax=Rhypophila decipiens TaxID=261697 RepID=A0AAN6XUV2_9PEZI|nr:hypothetical protein QBC37DRAFT_460910 [Rhypophila decipiens]
MGQSSSTENGVCSKPACVHAASSMMQNMAHNWEQLNPCTDFYEMTCGGFRERMGTDAARMSESLIQPHINNVIREVIERPYKEAAEYHDIMIRNNIDEQNHQMLQRDYQSCMNTEAREKAGRAPLIKLLDDLAEVWPVNLDEVDDTPSFSSSDRQHLQSAIIYLDKLGVSSFRALKVEGQLAVTNPNLRDPTVNLHYVTSPDTLVKDQSKGEKVTADIAKLFAAGFFPGGKNISDSEAESLAKEVVKFDMEILSRLEVAKTEIAAIREENPDLHLMAGHEILSFDELADLAPVLGLDKVLTFFSPVDSTPDAILVESPGLYSNLSTLVDSTPKAVIRSWMISKIVYEFGEEVTDEVLAEIFPRSNSNLRPFETCLSHTDETLRWIVDRYFISATYTDAMKELVEKMTTNIQNALVKRFSELDWMSDEVKARSIEKAQKMNHNVGFPTENPDLRSPNSLAAYYQGLNITDDYFSNVLAGRLNNLRTVFSSIGKPVDRNQWMTSAHQWGAFYSPYTNAIWINAGFTQSPTFHSDLPSYALYGGVGLSIGHEITHGFDVNGKRYDERGALRNWWDNTSAAAYEEKAACFVDQFSKFQLPVEGDKMANVSGELTLGENIADAGGLSMAFNAWKALSDGEKNSQNLPGLENFTHEQLFFLSWGNTWCGVFGLANNKKLLADSHSPDAFRIIGGAENSRQFKEAWNCPVKEPTCELF